MPLVLKVDWRFVGHVDFLIEVEEILAIAEVFAYGQEKTLVG